MQISHHSQPIYQSKRYEVEVRTNMTRIYILNPLMRYPQSQQSLSLTTLHGCKLYLCGGDCQYYREGRISCSTCRNQSGGAIKDGFKDFTVCISAQMVLKFHINDRQFNEFVGSINMYFLSVVFYGHEIINTQHNFWHVIGPPEMLVELISMILKHGHSCLRLAI